MERIWLQNGEGHAGGAQEFIGSMVKAEQFGAGVGRCTHAGEFDEVLHTGALRGLDEGSLPFHEMPGDGREQECLVHAFEGSIEGGGFGGIADERADALAGGGELADEFLSVCSSGSSDQDHIGLAGCISVIWRIFSRTGALLWRARSSRCEWWRRTIPSSASPAGVRNICPGGRRSIHPRAGRGVSRRILRGK